MKNDNKNFNINNLDYVRYEDRFDGHDVIARVINIKKSKVSYVIVYELDNGDFLCYDGEDREGFIDNIKGVAKDVRDLKNNPISNVKRLDLFKESDKSEC